MDELILHHYRSEPTTRAAVDAADPNGAKPGDRVRDVAIRRYDPQVGEIVVHFPRAGFRVGPV